MEKISKRRKLVLGITFVVLSFAIAAIVLEAAYRVYLFGWASFSMPRLNSVKSLGYAELLQTSPDPDLMFEFKSNLATYYKLARFETNSAGQRDKEYSKSKPDKTVRVAVIGDSFTMPAGVAIEDAYHSLLEDRFNARGDGMTYEFINFAVGGYNLKQYHAMLAKRALAYDPDVVLIGFCARNDSHIPTRERTNFEDKKRGYPFFESFAWKRLMARVGRNRARPTGGAREPALRKGTPEEEAAYMEDVFSRIRRIAEDNSLQVVVAYIDVLPTDDDAVRRIVEADGMRFVNATTPFEGTNPRDFRIYRGDSHPNAKANRIFADRIYELLVSEKLLTAKDGT